MIALCLKIMGWVVICIILWGTWDVIAVAGWEQVDLLRVLGGLAIGVILFALAKLVSELELP